MFGGAILHLETLIFWPALGRTSGHIFGLWGGGQFPEEGSSFIHYQCAPSASISLNIFLLILSFNFYLVALKEQKETQYYVRVYCYTWYLSNNLHDQILRSNILCTQSADINFVSLSIKQHKCINMSIFGSSFVEIG